MPIVRNASGHSSYVSVPKIQVNDPERFFLGDPDEYFMRIEESRRRIIEVIRFHKRPSYGKGLNTEVRTPGRDIAELAYLVDFKDGKRARRLRRQRLRERLFTLAPGENRLRSPQDVKRRRSAIFSGADLPDGIFNGLTLNDFEIFEIVEQIRRNIIKEAVRYMLHTHEIQYLNGMWILKVSVLDQHVANRNRPKSPAIKDDRRTYHGHPNRDRKRNRQLRVAA